MTNTTLNVGAGQITRVWEIYPGRRWFFEVEPGGLGFSTIQVRDTRTLSDTLFSGLNPTATNVLTFNYRNVGPQPKIVTNNKVVFSESPVVFAIDAGTPLLEGPGHVPDMYSVTGDVNSTLSVYGKMKIFMIESS